MIEKVEYIRTTTDIYYKCPGCGSEYLYEGDAVLCFEKHQKKNVKDLPPGTRVVVDNGSYGGEQGSPGVSWWSNFVEATVVKCADKRYLVEFEDGQRKFYSWKSIRNVL